MLASVGILNEGKGHFKSGGRILASLTTHLKENEVKFLVYVIPKNKFQVL